MALNVSAVSGCHRSTLQQRLQAIEVDHERSVDGDFKDLPVARHYGLGVLGLGEAAANSSRSSYVQTPQLGAILTAIYGNWRWSRPSESITRLRGGKTTL